MNLTIEEISAKALSIFEDDPQTMLVFLFGSRSRGSASEQSDIDFAILRPGSSTEELVIIQQQFEKSFAPTSVDLVDLGNASIALRYRVAKDGVLVLCRDRKLRQNFLAHTYSRYLDFQPMRARFYKQQSKSIQESVDGS